MTGQGPRSRTPPPVPKGAAVAAAAGEAPGGGASSAVAAAASRGGGRLAGRGPASARRAASAASPATSGGRTRSELAENLLRTATWDRVPDRDHLRPTPRPPRTLPLGLRDPVSTAVVLPPPAAPAPKSVGVPLEVADACDVDGEGLWPTVHVASGGAMPGPSDTAAIDEAWTRMLAEGEAGGYLAPGAAPNVLKSLAAIDRSLAAEYFRRLVRVNEIAVLLPEPMVDVTKMFCIDGAAGFAWLVALHRQLPTLRETTWGDVSVGLEFWVGREPLVSSVPVPGDDWANERDARMMGRLAPVARAGHGAMRLPLRESADRTFLLPSAPSDWDFVFAAPRLLRWFLPRVFTHHANRLATATRDPLLGIARLAAPCAMVSAVLAAYKRDRRLFRPLPLATWALTRFGPVAPCPRGHPAGHDAAPHNGGVAACPVAPRALAPSLLDAGEGTPHRPLCPPGDDDERRAPLGGRGTLRVLADRVGVYGGCP